MTKLVFGKYQVIRRLAVGGMGEIFLARQTDIVDRLVILKSLHTSLSGDDTAIQEFLDEARVAATLNHPNVIQIYEVGRWEDLYLIAMEYVRGENLAAIVGKASETDVRIPASVVVRIIHDAALGLDYAHHAFDPDGRPLHIVHRDVSPQNIMVTTAGVTKVVDFGIATASTRESRTATGVVRGKLRYMAPEQILGHEIDGRTDQFALGVVFWELLVRRRLFKKKKNDLETLNAALKTEIKPPSTVVGGISEELDRVVMRMLSRDRADRYPRCKDAADDLEHYLKRQSSAFDTRDVATLVDALVGREIRAKSENLSPQGEDFLISFSKMGAASHSAPNLQRTMTATRRSSLPGTPPSNTRRLMLGAAAAFAVGIGAVALLVPKREAEPPPPEPEPRAHPRVGTVTITSTPSGATVRVAGEVHGTTPLKLSTEKIAPGTHEVELTKDGHTTAKLRVDVRSDDNQSVFVPLSAVVAPPQPPKPAEPPPKAPTPARRRRRKPKVEIDTRPGYLTINSDPWAQVSIDGRRHGSTPMFKLELPSGKHRIALENHVEGKSAQRVVRIEPGKVTKLNVRLQ